MTYLTIDTLPDLSAAAMTWARPLTFVAYNSAGETNGWDQMADFTDKAISFNDVFSFTASANAVYDLFSYSVHDTTPIKVYDLNGNAVAMDRTVNTISLAPGAYTMDMLYKFVAPYSGTFYFDAGWTIPRADARAIVYADLNPPPSLTNFMTGTDASDMLGFATNSNDYVDGGAGTDTLLFYHERSQYSMVRVGNSTSLTYKLGGEGTDALHSVELVGFYDNNTKRTTVDLRYVDLTEALYVGYFGRAADVGGLQSFQAQLGALNAPATVKEFNALYATDAAVRSLVDSFGASAESSALYGGDNKAFVTAIYANLLNRAPDQAGLDFWSQAIDSGSLTRASASLSIMAGAQANDTVQGRIDAKLLGVKIDVAANFTFALDNDQLVAAYDGAGPAATVRTMLRSLTAETDVAAYQSALLQVVGKMGHLPGAQGPLAELAPADAEHAPILLTGMSSSHDAAALFA